ncbi:MAG: type III-B CRISPR module RAMP protein Cmr6 [Thermoanaerobaculia bacterium]|nr:MAG: type III-B CRISPR module RAMP protein Cmr6 [Thermoanaerobaculia bacterium]MBZ0102120.1 type III-B CRISPR module RAMP protein Cmr6 [Thermoanaerobaculia bacterium]
MPLAQDLIEKNTCSNPGLALTKLAPPLTARDWSLHLKGIVDAGARTPSGYDRAFDRLRARTAAGPAYRRVLLVTSLAPVICGMGERTPGENGLTLHPVYGVPILPGTSLKGILRAWVLSQTWGADWQDGGVHFRALFGQGGHDGAAAVVDILDALPIPGTAMFTLDVLTPHHADYYQGNGAPLGWEGPKPVPFLAAAKGVRYRVLVEGDPAWVAKAAEWLALALAERGVGAKSRAGYGRFACEPLAADHPDERNAAERNATARLTRVARVSAELARLGKDALSGDIEKWLRGEPVTGPMHELLPVAPEATTKENLDVVRAIGARFELREAWLNRLKNKKADERKKARARELIEAWDKLFPATG